MKIYRYAWGNNAKRATMKGRLCIIVASGNMRSVMVQFLDNDQREITSSRALRKVPVTESIRYTDFVDASHEA